MKKIISEPERKNVQLDNLQRSISLNSVRVHLI